MTKGICFTLKDGKKDWYDPVEFTDGLTETDSLYIVDNSHAVYEVEKATVKSVSWYELCQNCRREIDGNKCDYCELEQQKGGAE